MIINSLTPRFNDTLQPCPVQQPRFFKTNLTQPPADVFIKQPSFRAKISAREFGNMYTKAILKNDVPLLKEMIEEKNWQGFYDCKTDSANLTFQIKNILSDGMFSPNQKIRELFNDKNLFNLVNQYKQATRYANESGVLSYLVQIYFSMTEDANRRKDIAEASNSYIYNSHSINDEKISKMSKFPLSDLERFIYASPKKADKDFVRESINIRLQRIVAYNGDNTPDELLNCLEDLIMSPEILEVQYDDSRLIDKIASVPVNKENEEIISKIAKKLSEMELPDNEIFRNAGIIAAKNGNAELLKVFDSKHIYYKTVLQEPVADFPSNVQEILENAKINDVTLTSYANRPVELEKYLADNPQAGINSKDTKGNSLAIEAVKLKNLETLKVLAKHDDFDWNMLDKDRNNLLTQLIDFKSIKANNLKRNYDVGFVKQLLEFLRELPEGKFNINHTNYSRFTCYKDYGPVHFCFFTEAPDLYEQDIIAFPDFNPNLKLVDRRDSILEWVAFRTDTFKKLINHPNSDIASLLDPISIKEFKERSVSNFNVKKSLMFLTSYGVNLQLRREVRNKYNKNGILDLKDIEIFVNTPNFNQNMEVKFNVAEENIAHLLVDISPDTNNIDELMDYIRLFEKLNQAGFDFNTKDIFGRTPLDKAKECGNQAAINILKRFQQ